MIDRKEIELLIRANLKGGRDLTSITKSIKDLKGMLKPPHGVSVSISDMRMGGD